MCSYDNSVCLLVSQRSHAVCPVWVSLQQSRVVHITVSPMFPLSAVLWLIIRIIVLCYFRIRAFHKTVMSNNCFNQVVIRPYSGFTVQPVETQRLC